MKRTPRMEYVHADDVKIVKYLADREAWSKTNGNYVWRMMEEGNVLPGRTFHSLRNRFLKNIKPRLLTEFADVIEYCQLPRHFKNSLPRADLLKEKLKTNKNTLEKKKQESAPRPKPKESRKENVSPRRPESPSLAQQSYRVNSARNVTDVIVDSCEIDGWTVPHCEAIPDTNIAQRGEQPRKRKIYNCDSDDDLFEDSVEEPVPKSTPQEKQPINPLNNAQQQDQLIEARLENTLIEIQAQESQLDCSFTSFNSINRDITQIERVVPPAEENQEPSLKVVTGVTSHSKHRFSAILKKKRKRAIQNFRFQHRINNLSAQFTKVQRKHHSELKSMQQTLSEERLKNQLILSIIADCGKESTNPEAVSQVPEIVAEVTSTLNEPIVDRNRSSVLLQNMLKSLDEDTRKKILDCSQHHQ